MEAQDFQFNFMGYPQGAPQAPRQPQTQQQSRAALENELRMNEAKIAELKAKLNSNRATADGIDRQLAANRAGIGDIASSQAHQRAIDERAYRNAMAANAAATGVANAIAAEQERKQKLVADIKALDISIADAKDTGKTTMMRQLMLQREGLVRELGEDPTGGVVNDLDFNDHKNWTAEQWDMFFKEHTNGGVWDTPMNKEWYENNRPKNTAADVESLNASKKTKTGEQVNREREEYGRKKKSAYAAADRLNAMIGGDIAKIQDMNKRVNSNVRDREIESLLEFVNWDAKNGKFVRK